MPIYRLTKRKVQKTSLVFWTPHVPPSVPHGAHVECISTSAMVLAKMCVHVVCRDPLEIRVVRAMNVPSWWVLQ